MNEAPALTGRSAIVTGASRGIGAAIAHRFAAEGASVALVARTASPGGKLPGSLQETADAIRSAGGNCTMIEANLADPADVARIVPATVEAFGGVDILVNNAAWSRFVPIWEATAKHFQLAFQMNVFTPQALCSDALPHMRTKGAGWILNISSATADTPPPAPWDLEDRYIRYNHEGHATLYGASKAALDRLTAGWALELAGSQIAVNALAPVGAVASEGALAVGGWDERDHIEPVETMVEAALVLCSRAPGSLTGEVVRSQPLLKRLGVEVRDLHGKPLR
ncbi:SDR family NAD(P)-dependent oxidoreductase [Croceicoccus sp. F390]|uniref:SDR family NAD(P)-dependent oxidoreductase n=1 Tax=Croceicoccus esteveae TaxID=3075597 RepID=A0ABU2ZHN9_9SPHN|nr:SDR family NAD(P)-dependent oxidoreductase [Croceicoccus sp. F390]MDT0576110.1 SDR family NAD(P)-dependent oxidoreductase [Croceicoccus sp. F390]